MSLHPENVEVFRDLVRKFFFNPDAQQIVARQRHGRLEIQLRPVQAPLDPFRWQALGTITAHPRAVRLLARELNGRLPDHDRYAGGTLVQNVRGETLGTTAANPQNAGGITIPGRWIVSARRGYTGIAASTSDSFAVYRLDVIRSSTGELQRLVPNLAHELFGHTYLSLIGVPHGHGDTIASNHQIASPFPGIPYVGSVDDYLRFFIGHDEHPTLHVGTTFLLDALRAMTATFNALPSPLDLRTLPGNVVFLNAWRNLGANFNIMQHLSATRAVQTGVFRGQLSIPASTAATESRLADNLVATVMTYFNGLSPDKQRDFRTFVRGFQLGTSGTDLFGARANSFITYLADRIPS